MTFFQDIFILQHAPFVPNCKHTGFSHDVPQVRTVESIRELVIIFGLAKQQDKILPKRYLHNSLIVNFPSLVHRCRMDLEDLQSGLFVRQWDFDLPIQATGP
jgi:hypothetical protein